MTATPLHFKPRTPAAFTLLEVILAIVIALGILVVLLYFYQQATNLRAQAIEETERTAAARLVLDRITGELRAAQPQTAAQQALRGRSNSIEFVKADLPSFSPWTGGALGRATAPVSDLKRVRYYLESLDGTNVAGLMRSEEPMVERRLEAPDEEVALPGTNQVARAAPLPLIQEIRHLQFRYWGETNWLDAWNSPGLPAGVEISLAAEPLTNEMDVTEPPPQAFRRVVYLPGSRAEAAFAGPSNAPGIKPASTEEPEP
jgi:type II secretory pathway pseudopilin PulG